MEDSFIVDLYWRRDEQAIAETERKYGGACEGIARRFLPAAEDAEEIVQDAYLSLWNTIPPQRSTSLLSASRGGRMWSAPWRRGSFLMR